MRTPHCVIAAAATAVALGTTSASHAALLNVVNNSFENPANANANGYPAPTGWSGGGFTENISSVGITVGGDQQQYAGTDAPGTLTQDLGVAFQANTRYTVNFLVGNRPNWDEGLTEYGLRSGAAPTVDLGTVVSVDNDVYVPDGAFREGPAYTFTTGAVAPAGNVVVFFRAVNARGIVDNARVDATPVPEPTAVGLVTVAGLALLARRRRRA